MDITIEQNALAVRPEYEITTPACIYMARQKPFSWGDNILVTGPRERLVATIRSRFSFFRSKYHYELVDGTSYQFRAEKLLPVVYVCEGPNECYRLYDHKGLNYSIFQGDAQIAAFSKNRITIANGNTYDVRVNDDANLLVVICMVLTINASEEGGNNTTARYDFGQIGPEARPFDKSWEPS